MCGFFALVSVHLCVCLCMCVFLKERGNVCDRVREIVCVCVYLRNKLCVRACARVCVCVCLKEMRERQDRLLEAITGERDKCV